MDNHGRIFVNLIMNFKLNCSLILVLLHENSAVLSISVILLLLLLLLMSV
jgi:hypothetical protein